MPSNDTVRVFAFEEFHADSGTFRLARHKAPRHLIERWNARPIEGTGEDVSTAELDEAGRFRRLATGWGELPG